MALVLVTAPATEPLTPAELKAAWGIDFAEDDAQVVRAGKAARLWVEHFLRRALVSTTYDLKLFDWPDGCKYSLVAEEFLLPYPPLSSVTSVKYFDTAAAEQTLATTVYGTDVASEPGRAYLKTDKTWPDLEDEPRKLKVTVRFVAGYGAASAVPQNFLGALVMVGRAYYENPSLQGMEQIYRNEAAEALLWSDRFLGETDL